MRLLRILPAIILGLVLHANAATPSRYYLTALPAGFSASQINQVGEIVGTTTVNGLQRAAVYFYGYFHVFGTLPGMNASVGLGINNHGQICGGSFVSGGELIFGKAFISSGNSLRDIGVETGGFGAVAYAINDAGQATGTGFNAHFSQSAFFYNGSVLEPIAGGSSTGDGINNKGELCFWTGDGIYTGYLWLNGESQLIPFPEFTNDTFVAALNNRGHAVGNSGVHSQVKHAFFFANGQVSILENTSTINTFAAAINWEDQVVGDFSAVGSSNTRACIFTEGRMIDLNEFLPENSGWILTGASGITDFGQIIGSGTLKGEPRSFLLTPLR
jgi:uncharacterized membrane protein